MGIDVEGLERGLTEAWAEMTGSPAGDDAPGVTRACALNLVVYAPAAEGRDGIDAMLGEVFERNPCRAVVLYADPSAEGASIEARVSTRCARSSKGTKQVCGEQITIEAAGASVQSAASAVDALLVPDVPVFLWWKDVPHYEDRLFGRLVETADRVIIDSEHFDHPHEDLRRVASLIRERGDLLALTDLNWARLTTWRTLVASFWDSPEYLPHLARLTSVRLVYESSRGAGPGVAPKALLALGWLASRLGWEFQGGGAEPGGNSARFEFAAAGGRRIAAELRRAERSECGGGVLRRLTIAGDDAEFFVELKSGGSKLETGARLGGGEHTLGRVLDYEPRSEGRRLSRELSYLSHDRVYEAAALCAARLIESTAG